MCIVVVVHFALFCLLLLTVEDGTFGSCSLHSGRSIIVVAPITIKPSFLLGRGHGDGAAEGAGGLLVLPRGGDDLALGEELEALLAVEVQVARDGPP